MNRHQLYTTFHDELSGANTEQIQCLHDLAHDGCFNREAGVEFTLAVEAVADERGFGEGH